MFGNMFKGFLGKSNEVKPTNQNPALPNNAHTLPVQESNKHLVKIGDSVRVKKGIKDPDNPEKLIEDCQGRVIKVYEEILEGNDVPDVMIDIAWDSITLENMDRDYVIALEKDGFDWSEMALVLRDVDIIEPRDAEKDRENAYKALRKDTYWESEGEEGMAIKTILGDAENLHEEYEAWEDYLKQTLKFPFKAEYFAEGKSLIPHEATVKVTRIHSIDDWYGILMSVEYKNKFYQLPLADLTAVHQNGINHETVDLYDTWFADKLD
jgi:Calcium binding